jgi:hypothetical protein
MIQAYSLPSIAKHSCGKLNSFGRHIATQRYSQCILKLSPTISLIGDNLSLCYQSGGCEVLSILLVKEEKFKSEFVLQSGGDFQFPS